MDIENTVGTRIRKLRIEHKLTVENIASKLNISKSAIYGYETNVREMNYDTLSKFADLYNVSIDYIINGESNSNNINISNPKILRSTVKLPIIGNIPAGTPIEAITDFDGDVYIPDPLIDKYGDNLFALRVKGDSMSKVLANNTIAIIKRQEHVENGEIAVVLIDHQDATLKRFFQLDDETIVLKPDSFLDEYQPEVINLKKETIQILGKMVWFCPGEF